jgi:hypothetical protein
MATMRFTMRTLATLALWSGFALTATAQLPALTLDKAFETKPRQPGVPVTSPAPDQFGQHRIEAIPNPKTPGSNMGYVVRDAQNRPVRQFVSYDNKSFNIIAFYVDGQEAYREVYPPAANEPYQFRWLGPNGGKWGLDKDRDGRVDEWVVISPEEASQEILQAVISRDTKRLDSLLPTKENLDSLGLSAAETKRIQDKAAGAMKRMNDAAGALNLSSEAKWIHLELGVPHTTPADAFGGRDDLVVHKNGTILVEDKGKTHFLQTGELLMVGRAWKVVEGPASGMGGTEPIAVGAGPVITPEIAELVKQLDAHDQTAPNPPTQPALGGYYSRRAEILEQILQKLPADKQGDWMRLLVDSLAAASEGGAAENPAHVRLRQLKDSLAGQPNGNGAYAAFRLLVAENAMALANIKDTAKELPAIQEKWRTGLEAFIKAHPNSDDAGEAVLRLAMAHEFMGKDGEAKAKEWYTHLSQKYPQHRHAAKAAGAVKRLECEGKPLELTGTNLANGQQFSAGQLSGKAVVVFYWASWSTTLQDDSKKLKDLAATYGPKGLEIVTVCLDEEPQTASQSIQAVQLPGTHLHAKGGLDGSPLSTGYGIMVVPHFLVAGKDGKVINRNGQITTIEDDVKKLLQ